MSVFVGCLHFRSFLLFFFCRTKSNPFTFFITFFVLLSSRAHWFAFFLDYFCFFISIRPKTIVFLISDFMGSPIYCMLTLKFRFFLQFFLIFCFCSFVSPSGKKLIQFFPVFSAFKKNYKLLTKCYSKHFSFIYISIFFYEKILFHHKLG